MRLINLNTIELREFVGTERPSYVILSHTWGAEEVSLQELHQAGVKSKAGYLKILAFAQEGKLHGFEWGWVDTCCIDKTSSAELSEAINRDQPPGSTEEQFASSRWFTRGWTLQELLAPSSVTFYLCDWTVYGSKDSLQEAISRITGMPAKTIGHPGSLNECCVAQRISWAAKRETSRPEDISYCLMGILGVHMPLLYGEGTRAFTRLQEEVMKASPDPTILAWSTPSTILSRGHTSALYWEGLLPPSPAAFEGAGRHRILRPIRYGPWSITNLGIRVEGLPVIKGKRAISLLDSAGFRRYPPITREGSRFGVTYAIALIGCGKAEDDHSHNAAKQFGVTLYKYKSENIYYRDCSDGSLLLLDLKIGQSKAINCIMRLPDVSGAERAANSIQVGWDHAQAPLGRGFHISNF